MPESSLYETCKEVRRDRESRYGNDSSKRHENVGLAWTAILRQWLGTDIPIIPPEIVLLLMAANKICRAGVDPQNEDHYVDGVNYLTLAYEEVMDRDV